MITDDEDSEESKGGIVLCSGEFYNEIGTFGGNFKGAPGGELREAARFAMSIGILNSTREEKKGWKKGKRGKVRTIAHLNGQFDQGGKYNMEALFDQLGLLVEDVKLNVLISEYVTGGMRWIVENDMVENHNFNVLKEEYIDLFISEE